jgi:ComF family protein
MQNGIAVARRWGRALLSIVYPARCCACDALCDETTAFCDGCALTLVPIDPARACGACGLPLPSAPSETRCLGCLQRPPPFVAATAPLEFGGALGRAVRRMKWARRPELGRPLGRLLAPAARSGDLLVPVPLHPRRLRARGYNQAALLALAAADDGGPPVSLDALARVRDTPPQSRLGAAERRANVDGAFAATLDAVRGARVLLVDDVLTTGATAAACATALLDGGAAEVRVLTLARAMP